MNSDTLDQIERFERALVLLQAPADEADHWPIHTSTGLAVYLHGQSLVLAADHGPNPEEWSVVIQSEELPTSVEVQNRSLYSVGLSAPESVFEKKNTLSETKIRGGDPIRGQEVYCMGYSGAEVGRVQLRKGVISTFGDDLFYVDCGMPMGASGGPVWGCDNGRLLGTVQELPVEERIKPDGEVYEEGGELVGVRPLTELCRHLSPRTGRRTSKT
jgi:hypothetical protein